MVGTMAMIARLYKRHAVGYGDRTSASGYAVYQMMNKKVPGLIGFKPEKQGARAAASPSGGWQRLLPASASWLDAPERIRALPCLQE